MVSVCFYFQVHQPFRVKKHTIFDIGKKQDFFGDRSGGKIDNVQILNKVARKCYLPANKVMLELLEKHPEFKISFSFSGVFLEQIEKYAPEVLHSFQKLVQTGRVEILEETYHHSLSFLYSKEEFREQVKKHKDIVQRLFGYTPKVFRNTELIYNNELAKEIESMGYKGIIAEGPDFILGWRSPNFLYSPVNTNKIKLLCKNYKLSDDIAFRFSEKSWKEHPLTAPKFTHWVNAINGNGNTVNLFMDYETFGEHQWEETGIFNFLRHLPEEVLRHPDNNFKTPSEVVDSYDTVGELDVHNFISWADIERDLSAWIGNEIQNSAIHRVYEMEQKVKATENEELIETWRKLQTSDHFYYMCTKWFSDGDVHKYFNPYDSPYEAFINYMNALHDLDLQISEHNSQKNNNFYKELQV
ncbi:MAG TPA: glycoside hydrolase family 57 protein [Candidatus Nanoarchaeia archaeon]|nr:glycoside hydrolase family 57 protein [Candidatus Nanoarchaeia archaeon]